MSGWLSFRISILVYILPVATGYTYRCNSCGLSSIPSHIPAETTEVHLQRNQIVSTLMTSLMTAPNITLLVISRNRLTNVEVDSFSSLKIRTLTMSYNQLTSVPPIESLAYSLSILNLDRNRIFTVEPYTFSNFTEFKRLYLQCNRINSLGHFAFAGGKALYLRMSYNALTKFPCLKNIRRIYNIYLNSNPISTAPVDCGPHWNTLKLVQLRGTFLKSLDNITKHAPSLDRLEVGGNSVKFSDETFKDTRFTYIVLRHVSWLPEYHSSKATLGHVELGGIALHCIEDVWLDGMVNLRTFKLIQTSVDILPDHGCSNNTNENRTVLGYFRSLSNSVINKSPLIQFPNLTLYGYNASLYYLQIKESKISSLPCFPDNFKLYSLFKIDLTENQISHICNMNFAPNIRTLLLSQNPLFDTLFIELTNIPLSNLYHIEIESIGMESLSDSVLRATENVRELKCGSNMINLFPNIKYISRSVVHIELHDNVIPNVPCTTLDIRQKLTSLNLVDNVITLCAPCCSRGHRTWPHWAWTAISYSKSLTFVVHPACSPPECG